MGQGIALQLLGKGWRVVGYNRSPEKTRAMARRGMVGAYSIAELARKIKPPRVIWVMVPAGKAVDEVLFDKDGLVRNLRRGDTIIDGGNSFFENTRKRAKKVKRAEVRFVDVGVSGGPQGARYGACLMVGGHARDFKRLEPLFKALAVKDGYAHFEGAGAGHFVKMAHNGIEYGMMQAIAEGFTVLKHAPYKIDLVRAAKVYNRGSVIESRLIGWLTDAIKLFGKEMRGVSGTVAATGEGAWTVKTAKEIGVAVPIIEDSFKFRARSKKQPSYTGKILSALRNMFGGHDIRAKIKNKK